MSLQATISRALREDPARVALEFKGAEIDCAAMRTLIDSLGAQLDAAGIPRSAPVALVARNRPALATALIGLVEAGRTASNLYAFQSPEALAADVERARFVAIVAEAADWTPPLVEAARRVGSLGLALRWGAETPVAPVPGLEQPGPGPFREPPAESGLEILSSGTTGPPKRVPLPNQVLVRAVESIATGGLDPKQMTPDIVVWPIAGIGGACCMIGNFALKRPIVLLEKFEMAEYLAALQRHHPVAVNAPPAILRMLLDQQIPKEALGGLRYVYGGSAPLPVELQDAFEAEYGIPVIWAYGATEFCGTVTTWTPELHAAYSQSKRGSIGRPLPGVELRIVDAETGEPAPDGEVGYIEARAAEVSPDWVRTTDLGLVDEDGFVFHKGRGDGAIVRGGHKVLPEKVDQALREHPAVLDAATVGVPDVRLGQVPVAAIELKAGVAAPTTEELDRHLRGRLTAPHVPVRYAVLEKLPRTTSLKPNLAEIRSLFEAQGESSSPARARCDQAESPDR
jgi:acyl-CoA synthetase (AMP-forming)/AMP-acid ligase II